MESGSAAPSARGPVAGVVEQDGRTRMSERRRTARSMLKLSPRRCEEQETSEDKLANRSLIPTVKMRDDRIPENRKHPKAGRRPVAGLRNLAQRGSWLLPWPGSSWSQGAARGSPEPSIRVEPGWKVKRVRKSLLLPPLGRALAVVSAASTAGIELRGLSGPAGRQAPLERREACGGF